MSFEIVVGSILHLFKESVEFNLQNLLPGLSRRPVTGSAFTQARYKIKPGLFRDLLGFVNDAYKASKKKLWKGHVLLAGDGSTLNLPSSDEIGANFGVYSTTQLGANRYLARTLLIYDLLNNFVVDGQLSTMDKGETTLLKKSLSKVNCTDILILDRGFGHFCTIKGLMAQNIKFCVRLSIDSSNFAKKIMAGDRDDFITTWPPSRKEIENSRKNHLGHTPIQVRVTKVRLTTGETELLITNLYDQQKYTIKDIGQLYKLRWGVEEGFKNLKPKMKIEQFGCKKTEGVFQEFYAHIFCMNMVALAGNIANETIQMKTRHRKWKYKYNWKNAYRYVREQTLRLLFHHDINLVLDHLIKQISCSMVPIIPDRHFPRDMKASNKKGKITHFNK